MERSFRAVVISFTSKARSSANCAKSTHGKKTGGEGRGGDRREQKRERNSLQNELRLVIKEEVGGPACMDGWKKKGKAAGRKI